MNKENNRFMMNLIIIMYTEIIFKYLVNSLEDIFNEISQFFDENLIIGY